MSMTREEAAHILEYSRIVSENFTQEAVTVTYVMALAALRGPTREQVEKVWGGARSVMVPGNTADMLKIWPKYCSQSIVPIAVAR